MRLRLNVVARGIVRAALASSVGLAGYACSSSEQSVATPDGGAGDVDAGDPFADEGTFACDAPLPSVLDKITPAVPVDYVELRDESWIAGPDGGAAGAPTVSASSGTACATATDHDACTSLLASTVLSDDRDGWNTDGDIERPRLTGAPFTKQLLVYTRGDEVGALRNTADLAAFLGTVDNLEEARLLLQSENQTLVCTNDPRKSGYRINADGSFDLMIVGRSCGDFHTAYRIRYHVSKDGVVTRIAKDPSLSKAVCGRRPDGLRVESSASGSTIGLGAHFAEAAHLEAASVVAFRRLELELRRFGAPESFVRRARRARADEIGHARDTAQLARRFGGVVPRVDVTPMAPRDLFAFALENAVEGAVRETYGALVAAFQAERCASAELRPLLRRIARDEARHAELAHDVDRWVQSKLSAAQRADLADAKESALDELRAAIAVEPEASVARVAGVPTASEARVLLDGLDREILVAA